MPVIKPIPKWVPSQKWREFMNSYSPEDLMNHTHLLVHPKGSTDVAQMSND